MINVISFTDTSGKTLIHKELFDSISGEIDLNITYFLSYTDSNIIKDLSDNNCNIVIIKNNFIK